MYYYGIKKIGCAGAHAIEVSTQMTFPFSSPPSLFLSFLPPSVPPTLLLSSLQQSPSHTVGVSAATVATSSAGPVLHSPGLVAGGPSLIEEDEHGELMSSSI